MSQNESNTKLLKTPAELLQIAKEEHAEALKKGNFPEGLRTLSKLIQAHEAVKPPEQKQREEAERIQNVKQSAIKKAIKENNRLETLFKPWLKRDSWLVFNEAMHLNLGVEPSGIEGFFDPRDEGLWKVIQSCAGISLSILNINAKPKEWRVSPFEFVRWLKEKDQAINPKLLELLYPVANLKPTLKTTEATLSRSIIKVKRQKAIKEFSNEAAERARKQGVAWNNQEIPVTKADFRIVFKKEYPEFKLISGDSFDRDIAVIGIKFQRGTKTNKNNVLKSLFIRI